MDGLQEQDWIEGLLHSDELVRSTALRILGKRRCTKLEATKNVLQVLEQEGPQAFTFLYPLSFLLMDESSANWAIDQLGAEIQDEEESGRLWLTGTQVCLCHWLEAHPELVHDDHQRRLEELCAQEKLHPDLLHRIQFSRAIRSHSMETLQKLVEDISEACAFEEEEKETFPEKLTDELNLLARELADRTDLEESIYADWLNLDFESKDTSSFYRCGFAVNLLGRRAAENEVERMLRLLKLDWDWLLQYIGEALGRMKSASARRSMLAAYPDLDWWGRMNLSESLFSLPLADLEEPLTQLMESEHDQANRLELATALACIGTPTALKRALAEGEPEDVLEGDVTNLLEVLIASYTLMDDPVRTEIASLLLERTELLYETTAYGPAEDLDFADVPPGLLPPPGPILPPPDPHRDVGRNDLCPCGSGKKFKKCCLSK